MSSDRKGDIARPTSRRYSTACIESQVLALASTTYWFYAWGEDPFREHDEKGAFSVTLGECGFDSAANSSTEEDAHGW